MAKKGDSKEPETKGFASSEEADTVRGRIQKSMDIAQEEHRRELFRRRIELARQGVRNYSLHRMGDAVKAFHTYLRILEDWKGVPEGGLRPSLFATKEEQPELILIAGVYWDLLKLYDRTRSADREREFRQYLEKYILFTKGMPYQSLGAETLRKYISNEKPVHREEFKNAYKLMGGASCFIATSLIDVSRFETLDLLRAFRDSVLIQSGWGRAFVRFYYRHGPAWANALDRFPNCVRRAVARTLDVVALLTAYWTRSVQNRAGSSRSKD